MTFLKETQVIQDGIITNFLASKRFADYLNIPCTGSITNTIVTGGSKSESEFFLEPYLKVIKFSAFQIDPMTGNFGGEFRLGIYFDGEKEVPVTLGSIAANIKDVQENMFLSKEQAKYNYLLGPKSIQFFNVRIAGN